MKIKSHGGLLTGFCMVLGVAIVEILGSILVFRLYSNYFQVKLVQRRKEEKFHTLKSVSHMVGIA